LDRDDFCAQVSNEEMLYFFHTSKSFTFVDIIFGTCCQVAEEQMNSETKALRVMKNAFGSVKKLSIVQSYLAEKKANPTPK